jgi:DMSO/TMAO reductase YedYZ molybdopterin-dependent catalytic subunit
MGAIGQAEWQYVPMSEIFARAGIKPGAVTVLFWSGVDGNDMGRPMPYSEVAARADDIGVCFAMNGNPLTPDHGAPVRIVVPGRGGTASIKWVTEIRVSDKRIWSRLNTKGEVYIGPSLLRAGVRRQRRRVPARHHARRHQGTDGQLDAAEVVANRPAGA